MISLASIHEDQITRFQRNHFIISISELQNKSSIGHDDVQCEEHISIETVKNTFPSLTTEKVANLLLIAIMMKLQEGERRFLLSFTDETKLESMDLLNGLVHVLQIKATTEEQQNMFEFLRAHAGKWTEAICQSEENNHYIDNTLNRLRKLC